MKTTDNFKEILKRKMDDYAHYVYKISRKFPKEELYGSTSQTRRAALSVILNYIEGFARRRPAVQLQFLETSYGSLKESKYLIHFVYKEAWINEEEYKVGLRQAEEIGAMLWTEITNLENRNNV